MELMCVFINLVYFCLGSYMFLLLLTPVVAGANVLGGVGCSISQLTEQHTPSDTTVLLLACKFVA